MGYRARAWPRFGFLLDVDAEQRTTTEGQEGLRSYRAGNGLEDALTTPNPEESRLESDSEAETTKTLSEKGADGSVGGSYYDREPTTLSLEAMNAADAAIDGLPEVQRQLLMMHFGLAPDFVSLQEAAAHHGLTLEEVRNHLREAIAAVFG